MKKNKKNKAAKQKPSLLASAAKSLKKLRRGPKGKLSTAQKVVAGAALGALGISYLVKKLGKVTPASADTTLTDDAAEAEHNLSALE